MRRRPRLALAVLGLLLGGLASRASAASLVYTWTGTLTSVDPAIAAESPPFAVNDPFTATVEIDAATTGATTGNTGQLVYTPVTSISLALGGSYAIQGSPAASSLSVTHDPGSLDRFVSTGSSLFGVPDLGIWSPSTFGLLLEDGAGALLASSALPTAVDPNDWESDAMSVAFAGTTASQGTVLVQGDVTALGVVPEPGTGLLLGGGLLGLSVSRRRPPLG